MQLRAAWNIEGVMWWLGSSYGGRSVQHWSYLATTVRQTVHFQRALLELYSLCTAPEHAANWQPDHGHCNGDLQQGRKI